MIQIETSLLIRLIIAHLLADFVLQSDLWVSMRFKKGWQSRHLYIHGAVAGVLAYVLSGLWNIVWIPAAVAVTHILIDGIKTKYADNIQTFLADQMGHFAVIFIIWLSIINPGPGDIIALEQMLLTGTKVWVIVAAYIVIIWPSSMLISKITENWRKDLCEKESTESDNSLERAGRWIGWLERFLILTFVLLQQYAAIGFLVAAKSILRFNESRRIGEYILIGTLFSFAIAVIVGLMANLLLL